MDQFLRMLPAIIMLIVFTYSAVRWAVSLPDQVSRWLQTPAVQAVLHGKVGPAARNLAQDIQDLISRPFVMLQVLLITTLFMKPPLFTYLNGWARTVYLILTAFALLNMFLLFVRLPRTLGPGWVQAVFFLMAFFVLSAFALTIVVWQIGRSGPVSFAFVLFALIYVIVPFVVFVKSIIDSRLPLVLKPVTGLVGFVVAEAYLLLLLGLFNLGPNLSGAATGSFWESTVRIMYVGARHLFSLPGPGDMTSVYPFIEFVIGFLFNVLTVGFFTSYVSSLFPPPKPQADDGDAPDQLGR